MVSAIVLALLIWMAIMPTLMVCSYLLKRRVNFYNGVNAVE